MIVTTIVTMVTSSDCVGTILALEETFPVREDMFHFPTYVLSTYNKTYSESNYVVSMLLNRLKAVPTNTAFLKTNG